MPDVGILAVLSVAGKRTGAKAPWKEAVNIIIKGLGSPIKY
jgi:hypothetical protein